MTASVWEPDSQIIDVVNAQSTLIPQVFAATAGQVLFPLTNFQYIPGTGSLLIFVNGVFQIITKNFTETSSTSFSMTTTELQAGDEVVALGFVGVTATVPPTVASAITYGGTTLADILLNHAEIIVNSYAQLRTIQHIFWSFSYLTGAVTRGDGLGGGFYYYDATDTTSPDNGSTIIVAADGGRWKLISTSGGIVTQPIGDNSTNPATTKFVQQAHTSALAHLIHPSNDGKWKDLYKSGIRPAFHQQQWGGGIVGYELLDGATDTVFAFDTATGLIEDTVATSLGTTAALIWESQGIKVSETMTIQACWLKFNKTANPVDNLKAIICIDDGTGKPSGFAGITNGTSNLINGRQITSKPDGEWYRFIFAVPPTLTANTQYHLVFMRTGAFDATNFYGPKLTTTGKYPYGGRCTGDGTTWTADASVFPTKNQTAFLVEPVAANQMLRTTGGLVDTATFVMNEGLPLSQSKVFVDKLINYASGKLFTQLLRVSNIPLGKTLIDIGFGINHDRIALTVDTGTGFLRCTLYDSTKTITTIVGTSSVVGVTLMDIALIARTMGDGADYLQLWVNGVIQVQTANATYTMSPLWIQLGTRWIGGGFPIAPGWTQDMNFTALPSAQGWTFGGTATEANVFQVVNNKLYQNKNGYAATDTGFYTHAATGFNNSIGWIVRFRLRDLFSDNVYSSAVSDAGTVTVNDGTKSISVAIHEYFIWTGSATTDFIAQLDMKSWDTDFTLVGKGSDYYLFANNRLLIDGTGRLLTTTASNTIVFGDTSTTSGENADIVWTDFSYYNGGIIAPVISSGMLLHESGYFHGNQSAYLAALYNAGVPVSIKNMWNQARNYVSEVTWSISLALVAGNSTLASIPFLRVLDMESYCLGSNFKLQYNCRHTCSGAVNNGFQPLVDGIPDTTNQRLVGITNIGSNFFVALHKIAVTYSGLHKIEIQANNSSGTDTTTISNRTLTIESSSNSY